MKCCYITAKHSQASTDCNPSPSIYIPNNLSLSYIPILLPLSPTLIASFIISHPPLLTLLSSVHFQTSFAQICSSKHSAQTLVPLYLFNHNPCSSSPESFSSINRSQYLQHFINELQTLEIISSKVSVSNI
jgi:hypothetical protein